MLCRSKLIGFIAVLVVLVNDGVAESIELREFSSDGICLGLEI